MSSSIPPATDPSAPAPSDRLWLRSELMGTQVITRDSGRRLGVVGEVVVDIDRREVVALGLRDNPLTRFLPGLPRWMPLESIRQVGDVILVDSADSLSETFNPERYSKVINCQVITESGVTLGRVLGFSFDIETGELSTLVIGALGVPLLGEGVLSTWELAVGEIVSSGTDRIIVYEGAEEKLKQLGTGLLEKLGIGGSSWEQEERERFRSGMIPAENQLPAGAPSALEQRRIQPATSRAVLPESELDYVELEERREREPLRQRLYLDEDERDQTPSRRIDSYGEPAYGRSESGGRSSGARYDEDNEERGYEERGYDERGTSERFDPQDRWREADRDPGYGAPRRRPDRVSDRDLEEESGGRFEPRSWGDRDQGRDAAPEGLPRRWEDPQRERSAPPREPAARERGTSPAEDRPRSAPEPPRDPRSDRPARSPAEASAAEEWSSPRRQPLEASVAPPARPADAYPGPATPQGGDAEDRSGRDRLEASRRPQSSRRDVREPIDVEPEVLDDPW